MLINNEENLKLWIQKIYKNGMVAIDCETDSLSPTNAKMVGFSMSINAGVACYIPIHHVNCEENFTQIEEKSFIKLIKPMLEDNSVLKLGKILNMISLS